MDLLQYINKAVTPHQAVQTGAVYLKEKGFEEVTLGRAFDIKKGGKYYLTAYSTSLIAFTVGEETEETQTFHVAAAHTDHPCLHIKPKAEMAPNKYLKIDTEVYGGPILNTWLDRPLSVAGRVACKGADIYHPEIKLVDFARPIATIPNLAIHFNRKVNEGIELNKQSDMLPIIGLFEETMNQDNYFLELLAEECNTAPENILDFDLYVYALESGCYVGV